MLQKVMNILSHIILKPFKRVFTIECITG